MSTRPARDPSPARTERTSVRSRLLHVLLALAVAACGSPDDAGEEEDVAEAETGVADSAPLPEDPLFHPASEAMQRTAPDTFRVQFGTTAGSFTIEAYRSWAPRGADRFYNLARHGFYEGARFFRVIEGFVAQFGLSGRPRLDLTWRSARIEDDSVRQSNERGTVSFASSGDDSRTTQLFVNLADNPRLDGMGFAPLGRVVEGMEVVDDLHAGYEEPPSQPRILREGNAFLDEEFPELDVIESVEVVGDDGESAADDDGG
jgi:peptidyl-prolyl cis-trans isomerase A (cyclophilin A)